MKIVSKIILFSCALALLLSAPGLVLADTITEVDFEDQTEGTQITNQYSQYFTVTAEKTKRYWNHGWQYYNVAGEAWIFDSNTVQPWEEDYDLHTATGQEDVLEDDLGNLLIIQEDTNRDPDDNAYGGTLTFTFNDAINFFSTSVIDIEDGDYNYLKFYLGAQEVASIKMSDLITAGSFANGLIADLSFTADEGDTFDKVVFELNTSGGIGGVAFSSGDPGTSAETPEPASMLLFGTGLAGIAFNRLRRRKKEKAEEEA